MEKHSLTKWVLRKIIFETLRNASCFIDIIDKETAEYHEVHIVFHRYQKNSLKGDTRATRTKGYLAVHYKISDTTKIDHVEAKDFLSLIETKKN